MSPLLEDHIHEIPGDDSLEVPPLHGFYAQTPAVPDALRCAPEQTHKLQQLRGLWAAACRPRTAELSQVQSLKQEGLSAEFSCLHELSLILLPSVFREKTHREECKEISCWWFQLIFKLNLIHFKCKVSSSRHVLSLFRLNYLSVIRRMFNESTLSFTQRNNNSLRPVQTASLLASVNSRDSQ